MSKLHRPFVPILFVFLLILQFFTNAGAQDVETTVKIGPISGQIVSISGKNVGKRKNLSFLLSAAGVDKLGERISDVNLFDADGKNVAYRKFIAGEYVADSEFVSWDFKIDLAPPKLQTAAAHISWIAANKGIFMLADMLPQFGNSSKPVSARITLELPDGWKAFSDNKGPNGNVFESADIDRSVIFVGKGSVEESLSVSGTGLHLIFDGEWNFTYKEASDAAREIFAEYLGLFGSYVEGDVYIAVVKFKSTVEPGIWEAETRGRNLTIISSDMPFKTQSVQRLHEQLRHEIFHLWLPNSVNLTGNYDWFYEGFALYQSLKTGVFLNRISFNDFLDTLSRARSLDSLPVPRTSLIEASKNRWSGSNTQVYARGMLVAFLSDLVLLQKSKGKSSVSNLLREVFIKHRRPNPVADGNAAILNIMLANAGLVPIIEKYVSGTQMIDWQAALADVGIDAISENGRSVLKVKEKLSGRQKDLLDKLGYNRWRKLAIETK